jgi:hypothetical protein
MYQDQYQQDTPAEPFDLNRMLDQLFNQQHDYSDTDTL